MGERNVRDTHVLAQKPQLILQLLAARRFAHQRVVHLRSHLGHGLLELVPLLEVRAALPTHRSRCHPGPRLPPARLESGCW